MMAPTLNARAGPPVGTMMMYNTYPGEKIAGQIMTTFWRIVAVIFCACLFGRWRHGQGNLINNETAKPTSPAANPWATPAHLRQGINPDATLKKVNDCAVQRRFATFMNVLGKAITSNSLAKIHQLCLIRHPEEAHLVNMAYARVTKRRG